MIGRTTTYVLVAASYTLLIGILVLIVVALTTAVADGWRQRAQAAAVVDRAPQFSRDGSYVAFLRSGEGPSRLWVMSDDGTDARPVARATRFAWGAGHTLVFARGGRRFRIGADGGNARPATEAFGPRRTTSRGRSLFVRAHHVYVRDRSGATALT
jgi:Tol biopolymer transport system component